MRFSTDLLLRAGALVSLGLGLVVAPSGFAAATADTEPLEPISAVLRDANHDTVPDRLGQRVHVQGVVTLPSGVMSDAYFQAFIQDGSGGIYIFSPRFGGTVKRGDLLDVTGTVDQYRGAVQINRPFIRTLGQIPQPRPLRVGLREALDWQYYGRLLVVRGTITAVQAEDPATITIADRGKSLEIYLPPKIGRQLDLRRLQPGSEIDATGVLSIRAMNRPYTDGFQLIMRSPTELRILSTPPPPWVREATIGTIAVVLLLVAAIAAWIVLRRWKRTRERQLALMNGIAVAVAAPSMDLDEMLHVAVRLFVDHDIVDAATIHIVESDDVVRLGAAAGLPVELVRRVDQESRTLMPGTALSGSYADSEEHESPAAAHVHLIAKLPLVGRSRTVGTLAAFSLTRATPTPAQARILSSAAGLIGVGIENLQMVQLAQEREMEFKQLAITDDLTGLYNRRFLDEYLRIQIAMARRQETSIAFVSIDLDHFKSINDAWGHQAGDQVLAQFGEVLRSTIRGSDLAVRYGGEEFMVVMPNTGSEGALTFSERLRAELHARDFRVTEESSIRVTASIGVGIYPQHGEQIRMVLRVCDDALYRSKREGRDRVTFGSSEPDVRAGLRIDPPPVPPVAS
ncbi:MAG: diguanylate cyclase [Thermoanaerobaculia bacterium]